MAYYKNALVDGLIRLRPMDDGYERINTPSNTAGQFGD